jgi:hypothetical protein
MTSMNPGDKKIVRFFFRNQDNTIPAVTGQQYKVVNPLGAIAVDWTNASWDAATGTVYFLFDSSITALQATGEYTAYARGTVGSETISSSDTVVVMSVVPSLVTVAQVKQFLEIVSSEHDDKIDQCCDRASALAQKYCARTFTLGTYTQQATPDDSLLNGNGMSFLYLRQWPVISMSKLALVAEGGGAVQRTFGNGDYALDKKSGKVTLLSSAALSTMVRNALAPSCTFPPGVQNVVAEYVAGYAAGSVPLDLQQAVICIAAHMHLLGNTRRLGVKSIATVGGGGGGLTGYQEVAIPIEAEAILKRYISPIPR